MSIYNRVLTLQKVPQGGFAYVNGTQGIPLNSGMQFYIDSVNTGFFPPISPFSTDPNKYRKQKWLSIGLEGNSFRRYINENIHLNGIPSGLEPGHFVYFTIEPKSSLLEQGAGTQNPRNLRYISSLRAKPYMVVQNDANRDNSYEKTPSNLFTGVSGNNNFVKFHPQSRYKDLALQSLRFHPVIGNGYANYALRSGVAISIQPKNHHLETFIEINVLSGSRVNYGNRSRNFINNLNFNSLASGPSLKVIGASETLANGIYVANTSNAHFYVNENNYRIISGNNNVWTLLKPSSGIGYEVPAMSSSFNLNAYTPLYRTSGSNTHFPNSHKEHLLTKQVEHPSVGWFKISNPNENINVSRLVTHDLITSSQGRIGGFAYSAQTNRLGYVYHAYNNFGGINTATGSYLEVSVTTGVNREFSFDTEPKFIKVNSSGVYTYITPRLPANSNQTFSYFAPNFIYDNHGYNSFPGDTVADYVLGDAILSKQRINFKKSLSPNLHQAKKVNLKLKFQRDDKAKNEEIKIIKNIFPVQEKDYIGFERVVEFYDEKDNDTYLSTPFFSLTGKDYSFEQKELFIYRSRPDMNNSTSQNVIKW
jgi:hypothetical protein